MSDDAAVKPVPRKKSTISLPADGFGVKQGVNDLTVDVSDIPKLVTGMHASIEAELSNAELTEVSLPATHDPGVSGWKCWTDMPSLTSKGPRMVTTQLLSPESEHFKLEDYTCEAEIARTKALPDVEVLLQIDEQNVLYKGAKGAGETRAQYVAWKYANENCTCVYITLTTPMHLGKKVYGRT